MFTYKKLKLIKVYKEQELLTLNRFSAPARSRSSLLISWFNLHRRLCNLPRHVAARGSEPWKMKKNGNILMISQLIFRIRLAKFKYYFIYSVTSGESADKSYVRKYNIMSNNNMCQTKYKYIHMQEVMLWDFLLN